VGKVRLNATMTQNVVTYTVEVITDNPDGKLLPYLTANVKFLLATRQDVFLVPNAALRWFPQPDQLSPEFRDQYAGLEGPGSGTGGATAAKDQKQGRSLGTLWIPDGSYVRPVQVQVGMSDGSLTEIQGPEVKEGLQVIVAEEQQEGAPASSSSPFTPKLFRDKRPSPRQ
jgi:HlyD family secretion protein